MLSSIKQLEHCRIRATDGAVGAVTDTYFDDNHWVVRYLVADVGGWLQERRALLLPRAVKSFHWRSRTIAVDLSRAQIRACPSIDTHKPVSRQHEHDLQWYQGNPYGYGGSGVMPIAIPGAQVEPKIGLQHRHAADIALRRRPSRSSAADPHLRSSREVIGYHIEATDGAIGHVADLLFEEGTWAIPYAVLDTRSWLPGKRVRIFTKGIESVNGDERTVVVGMSCGAIRESPTYEPVQHARGSSSMSRHTSP
jgi:hypothetical protein